VELRVDELSDRVDELTSRLEPGPDGQGRAPQETPAEEGLDTLRERVEGLQAAVEELTGEIRSRRPVLPCWAEMDIAQAEQAWRSLREWLSGVFIVRYPTSASVLQPCWYRHTELVEELTWLHNGWTVAYKDPDSAIGLAADWHLYWLPHVVEVAKAEFRSCYAGQIHSTEQNRDLVRVNALGEGADLDNFVTADLVNRPDPGERPTRYVPVAAPPTPPRQWGEYARGPAPHTPAPPPRRHRDEPYTAHHAHRPNVDPGPPRDRP